MSPYKCVATGFMAGMLEIVLDSATIAHVVELSIGEASSTGMMKKLKAVRVSVWGCIPAPMPPGEGLDGAGWVSHTACVCVVR